MTGSPILPPQAGSFVAQVDLLYFFITAVTTFFVVLVAALMVYVTLTYRRRHPDEVAADIHGLLILELSWSIIPLILAVVMFVWSASLFLRLAGR